MIEEGETVSKSMKEISEMREFRELR